MKIEIDTGKEVILIDGIRMTFDALKTFTQDTPANRWLRFERCEAGGVEYMMVHQRTIEESSSVKEG